MIQTELGHSRRVLSIQSHVVHGYVGGKAAVFPLQLLGFDVDVVSTVQFSNHSGYGKFGGTKTTATELEDLFQRLETNGLVQQDTRLITGYVPGPEALKTIGDFVRRLKMNNKGLIYILDPVMGDSGKLYVSPEVVPIYKDMLSLATVITPNWFEVETLTGHKLNTVDGLRKALRILHGTYGIKDIVVTSIPLVQGEGLESELPETLRRSSVAEGGQGCEWILCVCSSEDGNGAILTHGMRVPKIEGYFSGVGDLFSALICGHYNPTSNKPTTPSGLPIGIPMTLARKSPPQTPLSHATYMALIKMFHILKATQEYYLSTFEQGQEVNMTDEEKDRANPARRVRRMRGRELRLIQCQDILRRRALGEFGMRPIGDDGMVFWENFWNTTD